MDIEKFDVWGGDGYPFIVAASGSLWQIWQLMITRPDKIGPGTAGPFQLLFSIVMVASRRFQFESFSDQFDFAKEALWTRKSTTDVDRGREKQNLDVGDG